MLVLKTTPVAGALALLASGLAATGAQAADLFASAYEPAPVVVEQPLELGTGWYLRGDAAWVKQQAPGASSGSARNGAEGDIGFGYKFTNWFRADLVGGWGSGLRTSHTAADTWCPYASATTGVNVTDSSGVVHHYLTYDPTNTCTPRERTSFGQRNLMLNGYLDLGSWGGFTPYVGAGVGVANLRSTGNLDFHQTSDGSLYDNVNLVSAQPISADCQYAPGKFSQWFNVGTGQCMPTNVTAATQNWSRTNSSAKYNFAWSLMAGFSFDLSDHAKIDVGYRYMNLGQVSTLANAYDYSNGAPVKSAVATQSKSLSSQAVRVGVRYMID